MLFNCSLLTVLRRLRERGSQSHGYRETSSGTAAEAKCSSTETIQGTAVCRNGCEATAGLSNRRGAWKAPFLEHVPLLVCGEQILARCPRLEMIRRLLDGFWLIHSNGVDPCSRSI